MNVVREDDSCGAHSESDEAQNLGCLADADQSLSGRSRTHVLTSGPIAAALVVGIAFGIASAKVVVVVVVVVLVVFVLLVVLMVCF